MWVLAAYASSFMRVVDDPWRRLIGLSHVVLANAARDATASFFETFVAIDHLASGRTEEFNASWSALERSLINVIDRPWVDNPIVRYANAVKRARPMQDEDFTYGYAPAGTVTVIGGGGVGLAFNLVTAAINHKKAPPRPLDLRTVQIVQTVVNHCHRAPNILSKFVEMTRQERNSPRARELYAEMSQRAMYPMLTPVWKRLVKQRVSLGARLKEHLKFHKI
jgi:hypothetical protein